MKATEIQIMNTIPSQGPQATTFIDNARTLLSKFNYPGINFYLIGNGCKILDQARNVDDYMI